ncbi:MAG: energy-coupling factor ABC transporter ATP-binding protein [archaeon]|nr:energy-coupling factor ABC transporter ATP-binding protein [archaeon]
MSGSDLVNISTKNLSFSYKYSYTKSLNNITINIKNGVKTVILGSNGAGKSTLFFQLNGVIKPDIGSVKIDGVTLKYRRKDLKFARSKIYIVFQNPDEQIFGQTVEDDIAYSLRNIGMSKDLIAERVEDALFQTGLTEIREKSTLQLSYGQKKRLIIAGAIAMRPKVLIMDEPTAGLDPQMSLEVMEIIEYLHYNGTTIVMSTHDVNLAYAWADEINVLRKGELIYTGVPETFFSDLPAVYSSGMILPSIFVINKSICSMKGISEAPHPRTETQLFSKLASGPKGTLIIADIKNIENIPEGTHIGVFGVIAKKTVNDRKLKVDYCFNGFELCVGDCISGTNATLICDAGCIPLVEYKLSILRNMGSDIPYRTLGRGDA